MSRITVPSFDLSRFDATAFSDLDDKVATAARDAAYITIGFGVLAFQQAQVRRRELERIVARRVQGGRSRLDEFLRTVAGQGQAK
ncbi:MAG: hypothetical protein WCK21_09900 [Actinomycetota bacterium]